MFFATVGSKLFIIFNVLLFLKPRQSEMLLSLFYGWRNEVQKGYVWSFEDITFYLNQQEQGAGVAPRI